MKDEPIVSLNGDMFAVRSCTEKHGVWIEKWHPKRKPDALDKLIEAVGADDGSDDEDADDWFFFRATSSSGWRRNWLIRSVTLSPRRMKMSPFDIGSFVRLVVPADRRGDCFTRGRIVAHEIYRDDNGTRSWWYVRWFNDDGKPDSEPSKHTMQELEAA